MDVWPIQESHKSMPRYFLHVTSYHPLYLPFSNANSFLFHLVLLQVTILCAIYMIVPFLRLALRRCLTFHPTPTLLLSMLELAASFTSKASQCGQGSQNRIGSRPQSDKRADCETFHESLLPRFRVDLGLIYGETDGQNLGHPHTNILLSRSWPSTFCRLA